MILDAEVIKYTIIITANIETFVAGLWLIQIFLIHHLDV